MATITWANDTSGDFATKANWTGGAVPGAADFADVYTAGYNYFTVTSSANETVSSLFLDNYASLDVTGGKFAVTNSTGVEGTITVGLGATFAASGTVNNTGELLVTGYLINAGSIHGSGDAVFLSAGAFYNGLGDSVSGTRGVYSNLAGSLSNHGTVRGTGEAAVMFANGGEMKNYGNGLVYGAQTGFRGDDATINNYGQITGAGVGANYAGIVLNFGVTYNSSGAKIAGYFGIAANDFSLLNHGLVEGYTASGVEVRTGVNPSTITNFGTIEGVGSGVLAAAGAVTVENHGTIIGTAYSVRLGGGVSRLVVEGGSSFTGAAVGGGGGTLELANGGGDITGLGGTGTLTGATALTFSAFGVYQLDSGTWDVSGGAVTNGQTLTDFGALTFNKTSNAGVIEAEAGGTITVYGTLLGVGTTAALDTAAGGVIDISNAASAQVAGALINAGTIVLASATSSYPTELRVLAPGASLSGGGTVTLSGPNARILGISTSAALTNVNNTIVGVGSVGANDMTLINEAAGVVLATGGLLTVRDAAGQALTNFGLMEANATGKLALVAETINQASVGTILAAGGLVTLQGIDVVGGTLTTTGAGRINVDGGGATLDGTLNTLTNGGLLQVTGAQTLTVDGNVANSGKLDLHAAKLLVGMAGVSLSGKGQVNLNDSISNVIVGTTAAATLSNVDNRIAGSGHLGNGVMTLVNEAGGQIIGNQGIGLTIDTGATTIFNAGLIENSGKGGTLVKSAVNNSGTLAAVTAGTLTLQGAVTGAGVGRINGGTLYVVGAFTENVTFTGSTGVLKLGDSVAYAGQVTGLSKTGTNSLDLADITFSNTKTKATFSGTTASGTLTVTDGTHTAKITLIGNYLGSTFTVSTDGHTGTKVVDPQAPAASSASLAQAMAGFQRGPGAHLAATAAYSLPRFPMFHARA